MVGRYSSLPLFDYQGSSLVWTPTGAPPSSKSQTSVGVIALISTLVTYWMLGMYLCRMGDRTTCVAVYIRILIVCNSFILRGLSVHPQTRYRVEHRDSLGQIRSREGFLLRKCSFLVWMLMYKSGSLVKNWDTPGRRPKGHSLRCSEVLC